VRGERERIGADGLHRSNRRRPGPRTIAKPVAS
jgi:hypothetical protein